MATANSLFEEEASAMDTSNPLYTHGSEQQNESTTFRDRKKMAGRKRKWSLNLEGDQVFSQIYIYDQEHELDNRLHSFQKLDRTVLKE